MYGDPKKKKKDARKSGRAAKKSAKQTAKTYKKGAKTMAKGAKQAKKLIKATGKPSSTRSRVKAMDARVKVKSGAATMANPTTKKKPKKKAYRTTPNINAGAPGQKPYLTMKGRQTNRKGGRS